MSVTASMSSTEDQEAFAREFVRTQRFSGLGAVQERGLEVVRRETEAHAAEVEGLRAVLRERREGPFIDVDEGRDRARRMLETKRAAGGDRRGHRRARRRRRARGGPTPASSRATASSARWSTSTCAPHQLPGPARRPHAAGTGACTGHATVDVDGGGPRAPLQHWCDGPDTLIAAQFETTPVPWEVGVAADLDDRAAVDAGRS
jgi:antitoxin ParD1/3/4